MRTTERQKTEHTGRIRAAVLSANDGLISTSSLVVGVASAQTGRDRVLLAALAGRVRRKRGGPNWRRFMWLGAWTRSWRRKWRRS